MKLTYRANVLDDKWVIERSGAAANIAVTLRGLLLEGQDIAFIVMEGFVKLTGLLK